jgi:hypothetical protein
MKITFEITRSNHEERLFDALSGVLPKLVEHYLRVQAERERRAEERQRMAERRADEHDRMAEERERRAEERARAEGSKSVG